MQPNEKRTGTLYVAAAALYIEISHVLLLRFAGQVGYVVVGMRNVEEAQIGDTFFRHGSPVEPLPGFKKAKPMVFSESFSALLINDSTFRSLQVFFPTISLDICL